jgi:hypothetical protein
MIYTDPIHLTPSTALLHTHRLTHTHTHILAPTALLRIEKKDKQNSSLKKTEFRELFGPPIFSADEHTTVDLGVITLCSTV